jgi:hypothetical protein
VPVEDINWPYGNSVNNNRHPWQRILYDNKQNVGSGKTFEVSHALLKMHETIKTEEFKMGKITFFAI